MPKPKGKPKKLRQQYGVLPYRLTDGGSVEVLLVTSRETRRWIIPKGWPIKKLKPVTAAKREAYEEAGIRGEGGPLIGAFRYVKRMEFGPDRPCQVDVFPLRVTEELDEWPEMTERERRWFGPEAAAEAVAEPDLKTLIRDFPAGPHAR
jgi:8-oxo-dGTP pyrophosphatase MutT (NUDIX family)